MYLSEYGSQEKGRNEVTALMRLRTLRCKHAPTYLGHFKKDMVGKPEGVIRYVLMTRLPGYVLADNRIWDSSLSRRTRVKKAFDVAIKSVYRFCIVAPELCETNTLGLEEISSAAKFSMARLTSVILCGVLRMRSAISLISNVHIWK